ncbi:MAG: DUF938 domain-containing protein [Proteobacteria bacterium]|nr:MAG: DUF938 domain-containing protein [Pseudomonadota bacterium]
MGQFFRRTLSAAQAAQSFLKRERRANKVTRIVILSEAVRWSSVKQVSEAAERNKRLIFEVLNPYLGQGAKVLEIASGTGQHAAHFSRERPDLVWQASDIDPIALASIRAYREELGLSSFCEPVAWDIREDLPSAISGPFDAVLSINMIHISPWESGLSLFLKASALLNPGGILCLYGPFLQEDVPLAASNLSFDHSLRSRNPQWGIRSLETVLVVRRPLPTTSRRPPATR